LGTAYTPSRHATTGRCSGTSWRSTGSDTQEPEGEQVEDAMAWQSPSASHDGQGRIRPRRHRLGRGQEQSELAPIVARGLAQSRIHQVRSSPTRGMEGDRVEVMRDSSDNCTIVCNVENVDPLGIQHRRQHSHRALPDAHQPRLPSAQVDRIQGDPGLGIIGECNIQFAMDPNSDDFVIIEVNSRLSRRLRLASKATDTRSPT
jgi:carbamoylphosphate synthase large subunit